MTDQSPRSVELPDLSEARFSIRVVMIAMLVMSVVAMAVGLFVRQVEPDGQTQLLVAWAFWLIVVLAILAFRARRRITAERLSGPTLLRLPMLDPRVLGASRAGRYFRAAFALCRPLLLLLVGGFLIAVVIPRRPLADTLFSFGISGIVWAWLVSREVTLLWWRRGIRFGESGILWDTHVILWTQVVEYRWNTSDELVLEIEGINQHGEDDRFSVAVPNNLRDTLETFLEDRMERENSSAAQQIPRPACLPSYRREKSVDVFLVVLVGICLTALVLVWIKPSPAAFEHGFVAGFVVSILTRSFATRKAQHAGPFFVRLRTKFDAWGFAVRLMLVVGIVLLAPQLDATNEWIVRGIGLFGIVAAVGALFRVGSRYVDLREHGIVAQQRLYWPWNQVRLVAWDRADTGKLILGRGWRQFVANVPRERRDAVDALLDEKVT